ncbi:helix-turn-helix domain-containing protein [Limnoglobus roseus]|uniref:Uncharacterized protein n=1 Tax=Limnoglobus roseus TaxID=2598579 RepID=A0A5C1AMC7_9BACT|nr:helix-turn-helix domain-containing protein [Limnoglobus roseus]QEL18882.1 hypothetical protein PX52LOC_05925 [Limnoglobus roseus]
MTQEVTKAGIARTPIGGMSLGEVAAYMGVTSATVRNWIHGIRCGGQVVKLAAFAVGSRDRVTEEALAQFQQECFETRHGEPPQKFESGKQRGERLDYWERLARRFCGD